MHIFYFLLFLGTINAHLCLMNPPQRGGLPSELVPGDKACAVTENCEHNQGERPSVEYSGGSQIVVTYQKNLELFNASDPGVFQIWFAPSSQANFHLLGTFPDEKSPSLTTYTQKVNIPGAPAADAILMVEYDPHSKDSSIYYQCADIVISDQADICLPDTYTAHVEVLRDEQDIHGHHHDEYHEGDYLQIWVDAKAQMSLVKQFGMEKRRRRDNEHYHFTLRDYNKKLQWKGYYNRTASTISKCALSFNSNPFEKYCLAKDAQKNGTGSLGKSNPVDYYYARFSDEKHFVFEDIWITTQAGTLNVPILETVHGVMIDLDKQLETRWMEYRQWLDMSEDPIDPAIFKIPDKCPH